MRQPALRLCWRTRETQDGTATDKRPLRHLCRFLLIGVYTGSRPGVDFQCDMGPRARAVRGSMSSTVVFHRHAEGARETDKRQPPVPLSPRLLAHMRRWQRLDGGRGLCRHLCGPADQDERQNGAEARHASSLVLLTVSSAYTLRHTRLDLASRKRYPDSGGRKIPGHVARNDREALWPPCARLSSKRSALAIGRK